jgi:transposase
MRKCRNNKLTFKEYNMDQLMIPMSLDMLIPEDHVVRVVNKIIERIDILPLLKKYKVGGTSIYHPKMLLKVIVYAYTQRMFSGRQIAKALRENIHFMWISGKNTPDFRTINRFRSEVMKDIIDEVFTFVLKTMIADGYVKIENYFLDGTKIEANANRYTFVWAKSVKKNQEKLNENVRALVKDLSKYIDDLNEKEDQEYGDRDIDEPENKVGVTPEQLDELVKQLNEVLSRNVGDKDKKAENKQIQKAVKKIETDYLPRLKKYEEHEKIFGGRNSYSKTDHDATFMRMKEDHMRNGQLKPGYNVQIGTENQFVLGYSIHQRPGDTVCLIPNLEKLKSSLGKLPDRVIADSGYGSEENYEYLERNNIEAYVKYNNFHYEDTKKFKNDKYRVENLPYDEKRDEFVCPEGRQMIFEKTVTSKTENGYKTKRRIYICESCEGCSQRESCTKSKYERKIRISFKLNRYKKRAKALLTSNFGRQLRGQRAIEDEAVFGRLKANWSFRRFFLRGLPKVNVEWGLLCIAHNISKLAKMMFRKVKDCGQRIALEHQIIYSVA